MSNHNPICSCPKEWRGDPYIRCEKAPLPPPRPVDPCNPSPCGTNTQCTVLPGSGAVCECMADYQGDPFSECKPECILSSDCASHLACIDMKCRDPCTPGTCGYNADCTVRQHNPICSCKPGYIGNPFESCKRKC